uniref:RPA interacting protein n=1 Tax=Strix occidentalis caurina TaxID=311401 RepID=A0A8D0FAY0_STROC
MTHLCFGRRFIQRPQGAERGDKVAALTASVCSAPSKRCMERLRRSRAKLLERYRQAGERACGPAPGALLVQEVMEQEWQALQAAQESRPALEDPDELAVLEEIQQELILQEQSVLEEYERSLQFDEECLNAMLDGLDASDKVICPVCRKNNLTVRNHLVFCQCGLYISTQVSCGMTEEKLRSLLENTLTEHSHRCFHNPEFTVTSGMEEETSLLMSCPVCDSWTILL